MGATKSSLYDLDIASMLHGKSMLVWNPCNGEGMFTFCVSFFFFFLQATEETLKKHYEELSDRPFFHALIKYMQMGPIVIMVSRDPSLLSVCLVSVRFKRTPFHPRHAQHNGGQLAAGP